MTAQPSRPPSLTTHALWVLLAKSIGFALALALPLVLVRRMTQEEFGLYKQVFFIVNIAVHVLPLGFGMSAFYFMPRERDRQASIVINILLFHATVGVLVSILLMLWPGALALIFNNDELTELARWLGILMLLWTIGSFLEIVTLAAKDVKASSGFIVTSQTSKTVLLIIAATTAGTVDALIVAGMVQGVFQIALMLAYLRVRFPGFWRAFDWRLLRTQAAYALPLGLSGLVLKLQNDIHHVFVSNAFGPAAYALYAVGVAKLQVIGILRESVGSVVLPRINELETQNNPRQILLLVASAARKLALVYFPFYAFLMVTGREVIGFLFTDQYLESWPIFAISLTIVPFGVLVLDPITRAHSERYFFLRMRIGLFVTLTTVLWFGAGQLGLLGIISLVVVVSATGWLVAAVKMARLLNVERRDLALFADVGRIAASALIAGLVCAAVRSGLSGAPFWAVLAVCAPIYGVVYVAAIGRAGVVRPAEYGDLWHVIGRMGRRPPALRSAAERSAGAKGPRVQTTAPAAGITMSAASDLGRRGE